MTNSEQINSIVADYISNNCSPTKQEKGFAEGEYAFLNDILAGELFQSGSYTRFTSITPLNDLDVVWILSQTLVEKLDSNSLKIENILEDLAKNLEAEYKKKGKIISAKPQPHSVLIEFPDREHEFSIDIVPAYELREKNEFRDPFYKIPEIGLMNRRIRKSFYESLKNPNLVNWIKTDPKGYKLLAQQTNDKSPTFRKATKLLKKWKRSWKKKKNFGDTEFKLKSFHLELIVEKLVEAYPQLNILTVTEFILRNINSYINNSQFLDRAQDNPNKPRYIDEYVNKLSSNEKRMISIAAASGVVLIRQIGEEAEKDKIANLLNRFLAGEEFIEAYGYSIDGTSIKDKSIFKIDGNVTKREGFPYGWLTESIPLLKGLTKGNKSRDIYFDIKKEPSGNFVKYWKVRNTGLEALKADSLRGEISKNRTLRRPETTAYVGGHFVTCYLVDESTKRIVAYDTVEVRII